MFEGCEVGSALVILVVHAMHLVFEENCMKVRNQFGFANENCSSLLTLPPNFCMQWSIRMMTYVQSTKRETIFTFQLPLKGPNLDLCTH